MAESSRAARGASMSPADVRRIQDEEAYPYIISTEIGKGSFATVFKGFHNTARKPVAIKTVSRSILTHKLLENLESEIAILKALTHKHITELTDIVKARTHIYLVMEFCSGGDLSRYIRHRGRVEGLEYAPYPGAALQWWPHPKSGGLDPVVVRYFIVQLASALKFLRQRDLIHRDIKPQNILLAPSTPVDAPIPLGVPLLKIADFGFARSLPNAALAETLCGSPLYMAPEILKYEKYDAKADLWSVGAVVYEMSVGKPPFRAQNHMELVKKIEQTRGRVNFPDEVAAREALKSAGLPSSPRSREKEVTVVPSDIKVAIRMLLKRKPVERATFEEFFDSDVVKELLPAVDAAAIKNTPASNQVNWKASQSTSSDSSGKDAFQEELPEKKPSRPDSKRRRSSRVREKAETDAQPLEGTPYDPKNYVPQPSFKFRRSAVDVREDSSAGRDSSAEAGPSQPRQPSRRASSCRVPSGGRNHDPENVADPRISGRRSTDVVEGLAEAMATAKPEKEEYVIIDSAAVAAENDNHRPWKRPSPISRTTTSGVRGAVAAAALTKQMGKQMGKMVIGATIGNGGGSLPSTPVTPKPPPTPTTPATPSSPTQPIPIVGRQTSSAMGHHGTPPFAIPSRRVSEQPPHSELENEEPRSLPTPMTFPPAPNPPHMASSPPTPGPYSDGLPRSQPNALTRALNLASKKLWGSPTHAHANHNAASPASGSDSPRFISQPLNGELNGQERSKLKEAEENVLAAVENVASKAQVLKEFADAKYDKLESMPSKPLASPSQYPRKKTEYPRAADSRRKAEMEAEQNALTSIALYLATMGFCQKGLDELTKFCEDHADSSGELSDQSTSGIDDALNWFRETFKSCIDRSELVKGWLPEGRQNTPMFIDRVIYDHALSLMKHAGSKEILDENFPLVQREYERALWMLYAIEDDVIQEGNPYREQDVKTINTFIESTKTRLMRLKRRMETLSQRSAEAENGIPSPR